MVTEADGVFTEACIVECNIYFVIYGTDIGVIFGVLCVPPKQQPALLLDQGTDLATNANPQP